jgi:hypothetical protein
MHQHACVTDPQSMADCPRIGDCGLRSVWRHLYRRVTGLLEQTSLADLLKLEATVDEHVQNIWPSLPGTGDRPHLNRGGVGEPIGVAATQRARKEGDHE